MTYRRTACSEDCYDPEPRPRPDWVVPVKLTVSLADHKKAKRKQFWRGVCFGGLIVGASFIAGAALAEPVLTALYIDMTPTTGGTTVRLYGGVLSTPEMCDFAGKGIKDGIEAEVADVAVTITCKPLPDGVAA